MGRILSVIRKKSSLECLPCDRLNLDFGNYGEYQDNDQQPPERPFEHPCLSTLRKRVPEREGVPSILQFFLDGSRRTYKMCDVVLNGKKYLPVVAGQVGVAVVERTDDGQAVRPLREFCRLENVIAFPNSIDNDELLELETEINQQIPVKFRVLRPGYQVKPDADPIDLGIARIMSEMQDFEIDAVRRMEEEHHLSDLYRMLVIDGPLRFKKKFDLVQFRNVLGISKSFRPSFVVGKGSKRADVGSITKGLNFGERTSVFKSPHEGKAIGVWYMRIRQPRMMMNPLQGIVKIEKYAVDSADQEEGFDADRIDNKSLHILRERNVSPYQSDSRWASHIYPIYLAESYLKASFMSDMRFQAMF